MQVRKNLFNSFFKQYLTNVLIAPQITYKSDTNQISFLQLLSSNAEQNITYHCKNSVGYFDTERRTYRRGLKLLGWNDLELTPRGNQRSRYEMIVDECRVSIKFNEVNQFKLLFKYTIQNFNNPNFFFSLSILFTYFIY